MEENRELEDIRTTVRLTDGALNFLSQRLALAEQVSIQLKDGLDAQQQVTKQLMDEMKRQSALLNMALIRMKAMEGSDGGENGESGENSGSVRPEWRKSLKLKM